MINQKQNRQQSQNYYNNQYNSSSQTKKHEDKNQAEEPTVFEKMILHLVNDLSDNTQFNRLTIPQLFSEILLAQNLEFVLQPSIEKLTSPLSKALETDVEPSRYLTCSIDKYRITKLGRHILRFGAYPQTWSDYGIAE